MSKIPVPFYAYDGTVFIKVICGSSFPKKIIREDSVVKLSSKVRYYSYVVIRVGKMRKVSQIVEAFAKNPPYWDEEVLLELNANEVHNLSLNIKVYHNTNKKDDDGWVLVGEMTSSLRNVIRTDVEYLTNTTDLFSLKSSIYSKSSKIQLSVSYYPYMPLRETHYDLLVSSIKENYFKIVRILVGITINKEETSVISGCLFRIFAHRGNIKKMISYLTSSSILQMAQKEEIVNTAFRDDNISTKLVEHYMLEYGKEYIQNTLGGWIQNIILEDYTVSYFAESDNLSLDSLTDDEIEILVRLCDEIFPRIFSSHDNIPSNLKSIFRTIYFQAKKNFPDRESIPQIFVNAFLVLRYLAPAMLYPYRYNILPVSDAKPQRLFILISNILKQLAMTHDPHPAFSCYADMMKEYVENIISGDDEDIVCNYVSEKPESDLGRLHRNILIKLDVIIQNLPESQAIHLQEILEQLSNLQEHEKAHIAEGNQRRRYTGSIRGTSKSKDEFMMIRRGKSEKKLGSTRRKRKTITSSRMMPGNGLDSEMS